MSPLLISWHTGVTRMLWSGGNCRCYKYVVTLWRKEICIIMGTNKIGALFDLDGVIIDSESLYTEFWRGVDRLYPTGIDDYAIAIKGTTLEEIMKHYDDETVKEDILRRLNKFQSEMRFAMFDGVEAFLEDLKKHNIGCVIVTSSDHEKMNRLFTQLPNLKGYFEAVIDASMISRSKPDPEGYLLAAKTLGCRPEDCYVFEDSLQGIRAGKASGATVVGLATTLPRTVIDGEADIVVDGMKELSVEKILSIS